MADAASLAAFKVAFELRIPERDRVNLSQPKPGLGQPQNDPIVEAATADAATSVETALGKEITSSDPLHVKIMIKAILLQLAEYKRQGKESQSELEKWLDKIEARHRQVVGGNQRVLPVTSTGLQPVTPRFADLLEIDLPLRRSIPTGPTWPQT